MPLPAAQDAPLGATVMQDGTSFKVWAPKAEAVHAIAAFLGFDATLDDRLRKSVRSALAAAACGRSAQVDLDPVTDVLRSVWGFPPPPRPSMPKR